MAIFTEDEAKTKWCPHVRLAAPADSEAAGTSGNRYGELLDGNFRCVGSQCMAWRWAQMRNPAWKPNQHMMSSFQRHPDDEQPMYISDDKRGYCGLAGRP